MRTKASDVEWKRKQNMRLKKFERWTTSHVITPQCTVCMGDTCWHLCELEHEIRWSTTEFVHGRVWVSAIYFPTTTIFLLLLEFQITLYVYSVVGCLPTSCNFSYFGRIIGSVSVLEDQHWDQGQKFQIDVVVLNQIACYVCRIRKYLDYRPLFSTFSCLLTS